MTKNIVFFFKTCKLTFFSNLDGYNKISRIRIIIKKFKFVRHNHLYYISKVGFLTKNICPDINCQTMTKNIVFFSKTCKLTFISTLDGYNKISRIRIIIKKFKFVRHNHLYYISKVGFLTKNICPDI